MTLGNEVIYSLTIRARPCPSARRCGCAKRLDVVSKLPHRDLFRAGYIFLVGKTETFTFLRRSWRGRPSPSPRSGHAKQKKLPTSEDAGGIALHQTSLQPPSLGLQMGVMLARPDLCRDRRNVGMEVRGANKAGASQRGKVRAALPRAHRAAGPRRPQPGRAALREALCLTLTPGAFNFSEASATVLFGFFFSIN